ncbi:MAG: hypothetical protein IJT65_02195 [Eubacterium sp.]|nr:hypothetical protein [Eubacterium sp.]
MKNEKRTFSQLIYNDKALIIVALILAVIVWTIASLNIGTDETKTIKAEVPIKLGDELSEQIGMQYYSLHDTVEVSVSISGPKYVIGQVSSNDLSIKFDTSNVNRVGAQSVPILVSNKSKSKDFTITDVYPSSIEAYFDVSDSKILDLNLEFDEEDEDVLKSGYVFGDPVFSADRILVSGPKTYVERIDNANLDFSFGDASELTEAYNTDCKIILDGVGVETSYIKVTSVDNTDENIDKISVTVPVLKEVELPVIVQFENSPSGIKDSDIKIRYSKKKLHAGILDSADITSAVIGKIDFNKLEPGLNTFSFDVTTLKGITSLEDFKKIKVRVTISDDYSIQSVPIDTSNISFKNVPKGKKAVISGLNTYSLKIVAPQGTEITANDISITCDLANQNADDSYNLDVNVKNNKSWVSSKYTATVTIK